ncbi:hypothetical protein TURU_168930 [Turdus rufiventris]|nr:hypothetical protein TURU_168930 [Turdus rufiventris]
MAPVLWLGLLLGLLGDPGGATEVLHSLRYLAVGVSEPSPGIPQFMSIGYLDGIPFERYDSERGQAEPLTEWVKEAADAEYWDEQTQIGVWNQRVYAQGLDTLRDRYNQSGGKDSAAYSKAAGEYQGWIQLWILSVWISEWIVGLIPVCDVCWNLMDLLFLQQMMWEQRLEHSPDIRIGGFTELGNLVQKENLT